MVSKPQRELVTVQDAAKILKCSPNTIYRTIREHKLGEAEGVFLPFKGERNYRIDVALYLNWRNGAQHLESAALEENSFTVIREMLGIFKELDTAVQQVIPAMQQGIPALQQMFSAMQQARAAMEQGIGRLVELYDTWGAKHANSNSNSV